MTLGEGAAFVMLEPYDEALAAGRKPLAELVGFGMSSDAHHMTAPPPDGAGAELAMRRSLERAGLTPHDVHYVNAHGTGTVLNDAAEAAAIHRVFGHQVAVSSCKGLLGHTLGASGALEAVASVLSIAQRQAFVNLGAQSAASDCPVQLVHGNAKSLPDIPVVLSNSFAFGGNNCSLVFRGIEETQA